MAVSTTSTPATLTYSRSILWLYCGRSASGVSRSSAPSRPTAVTSSWASSATCVLMGVSSGRDQVDEREDDDPHDVDEVPVETDDIDDLGPVPVDAAPQRDDDERDQHDDPDAHVDAV